MLVLILVLVAVFFMVLAICIYKSFLSYRANHILSLSKNLKRNYSSLMLGDYAITPKPCVNEISYANYYRNVYTDRLILERYYSLVKSGGSVNLYIDLHQSALHNKNKVSSFDYQYIHPVTLFEEGIDLNHANSKKIKILNLFKYIFTGMGKYKKKCKFSTMIIDQTTGFYSIIEEMDDFCKKRELKLNVFVRE